MHEETSRTCSFGPTPAKKYLRETRKDGLAGDGQDTANCLDCHGSPRGRRHKTVGAFEAGRSKNQAREASATNRQHGNEPLRSHARWVGRPAVSPRNLGSQDDAMVMIW
ncbi:hypothetical protein CDD83_5480 [Cordyceps sp. RAO-2017]|nr:hypothetical protein CDD83_5480 [Cordyceps sp. RAO-2017]